MTVQKFLSGFGRPIDPPATVVKTYPPQIGGAIDCISRQSSTLQKLRKDGKRRREQDSYRVASLSLYQRRRLRCWFFLLTLFCVFAEQQSHDVLTFPSCHSRPLSSRASQQTEVSFCRIRFQSQTNGYVRNNPILDVAFCDRLFDSHHREPMAKTDCSASGKTSPTPNWPLRFSASTFRDPKFPQTT